MAQESNDAKVIVRAIEENTRAIRQLIKVVEKNTRPTPIIQNPPSNTHSIIE